ncbi:AfsR/SARP family transcriptional regulator [Micromonospora sp. CPCC 205371]|nr:AfsR/SARP family transcriptional regulator [Micromonospora sp. CPCC 205371]
MRFRMLGPLRVQGIGDGAVSAAQQRVVLSVLLVEAGRPVTVERLIDEIWDERPPRAAVSVVRGYVMRLRHALGSGTDGPLRTRQAGYELTVDDDDVDARVFSQLVAAGRRAVADGDPQTAANRLAKALALWRGAALADVPATRTVATYAARLESDRLAATEEWLSALLELGRHSDVASQLQRLVVDHPLRERLWELLVLALHRCGRRGEALDAYRQARAVLAAELGLEPGAALQELQRAVLSDGVAAPTASFPAGWPRRLSGYYTRHRGRANTTRPPR